MLNYINKIKLITIFACLITLNLQAADSNYKLFSKIEDISYLAEGILKDYLLITYDPPKKHSIKHDIKSQISKLEDNIRYIARENTNSNSKDILDYISYTKDQIKNLSTKDYKKENAQLILEKIETLKEGVSSMLSTYNNYNKNSQNIKNDLLDIYTLYLATNNQIDSKDNQQKIINKISVIDKKITKNSKNFRLWSVLKQLLKQNNKIFTPYIIHTIIDELLYQQKEKQTS